MSRPEKRFPWGLWAFIGFVAWIPAMFIVGVPILAMLAPAAGVICGWIAGGIVYLLIAALPTSKPGR